MSRWMLRIVVMSKLSPAPLGELPSQSKIGFVCYKRKSKKLNAWLEKHDFIFSPNRKFRGKSNSLEENSEIFSQQNVINSELIENLNPI